MGRRRDGRRWITSILLSLCLNAAGLGLTVVMPRSPLDPSASGASNASGGIRVSLVPSLPGPPAAATGPSATKALRGAARKAAPGAIPPVNERASAGSTVEESVLAAGEALPGPVIGSAEPNGAEPLSYAAAGEGLPELDGLDTTRSELLGRIDSLIRVGLTYPPLARDRNIQGEVRVSLLIGTDGGLAGSAVVSGSGSSILDKAAIALVRKIFPLDMDRELTEQISVVVRIVYSLTS